MPGLDEKLYQATIFGASGPVGTSGTAFASRPKALTGASTPSLLMIIRYGWSPRGGAGIGVAVGTGVGVRGSGVGDGVMSTRAAAGGGSACDSPRLAMPTPRSTRPAAKVSRPEASRRRRRGLLRT